MVEFWKSRHSFSGGVVIDHSGRQSRSKNSPLFGKQSLSADKTFMSSEQSENIDCRHIRQLSLYLAVTTFVFGSIVHLFSKSDLWGKEVSRQVGLGFLPVLFCATALFFLFKFLRLDRLLVWTSPVVFIISSAIYLGIGPIVFAFGDSVTREFLESRNLRAEPWELARAVAASYYGASLILLGMFVSIRNTFKARTGNAQQNPAAVQHIGIIFLIIGSLIKYGLIIPNSFEIFHIITPGILGSLSYLIELGIGMLSYSYTMRNLLPAPWFFLILILQVAIGILEFSKFTLLLPLVFLLAGYVMGGGKLQKASLFTAFIVMFYIAFIPICSSGRQELNMSSTKSLSSRCEILYQVVTEKQNADYFIEEVNSQPWWTRLMFTDKQAYAMREYDAGRAPSERPVVDLGMFVPRLLWPSKPLRVGPGKEFYQVVTGRTNNFMALSIYGDLYWRFGWSGILFGCSLVGILFGLMFNISYSSIKNGEYWMLPSALLAILIVGQGPFRFIENGIIAPLPIYLAVVGLGYFFQKITRKRRAEYAGAKLCNN